MRRHFIVDGSRDTELAVAFRWLVAESEKAGRGAIAIPSLGHLNHLGRVIGDSVAEALRRDRLLRSGRATIELIVNTKAHWGTITGPLLAVWVDDAFLSKLMEQKPDLICVAFWLEKDVQGWVEGFGPTNLITGAANEPATIENRILLAALRELDSVINRSTGLTHQSDRARAVNVFRLLRDENVRYDARAIRAWAVQHGWAGGDADELADVARKIQDRRALRAPAWTADHRRKAYERWNEEADGTDLRDTPREEGRS